MLAASAESQNLVCSSQQFIGFDVDVSLRPLAGSTGSPSQQPYKFRIPGINEDFQFCWGDEQCGNILDALVAAEPAQSLDSDRLYDLALYRVKYITSSLFLKRNLTKAI